MTPIPEWHDVDAAVFRNDIVRQYRPAVLRGLVAKWPAVRHATESPESFARYLKAFDSGKTADALLIPAHEKGRIFYNETMTGFNFSRNPASVSAVSDKLLRYRRFESRPSLAMQSALIAECLPGFGAENALAILDASIQPRIWLGNNVTTPAHFDESKNIACVAAGRRRFTLLPPEQVANLYVGPLDFAPTGTPISLVNFREPDFDRFPRFREALAAALVAELEPGDAIYIPALWWHHVESLEKYNALVNYWWKGTLDAPNRTESAWACLLHSIVELKRLPPEHRKAWGAIFAHYIFDPDTDPAAHIPSHKHGVLGDMSPEFAAQVRAFVAKELQK